MAAGGRAARLILPVLLALGEIDLVGRERSLSTWSASHATLLLIHAALLLSGRPTEAGRVLCAGMLAVAASSCLLTAAAPIAHLSASLAGGTSHALLAGVHFARGVAFALQPIPTRHAGLAALMLAGLNTSSCIIAFVRLAVVDPAADALSDAALVALLCRAAILPALGMALVALATWRLPLATDRAVESSGDATIDATAPASSDANAAALANDDAVPRSRVSFEDPRTVLDREAAYLRSLGLVGHMVVPVLLTAGIAMYPGIQPTDPPGPAPDPLPVHCVWVSQIALLLAYMHMGVRSPRRRGDSVCAGMLAFATSRLWQASSLLGADLRAQLELMRRPDGCALFCGLQLLAGVLLGSQDLPARQVRVTALTYISLDLITAGVAYARERISQLGATDNATDDFGFNSTSADQPLSAPAALAANYAACSALPPLLGLGLVTYSARYFRCAAAARALDDIRDATVIWNLRADLEAEKSESFKLRCRSEQLVSRLVLAESEAGASFKDRRVAESELQLQEKTVEAQRSLLQEAKHEARKADLDLQSEIRQHHVTQRRWSRAEEKNSELKQILSRQVAASGARAAHVLQPAEAEARERMRRLGM